MYNRPASTLCIQYIEVSHVVYIISLTHLFHSCIIGMDYFMFMCGWVSLTALFCTGGYLELFDPYPFIKLSPYSVIDTFQVADYMECAERCVMSTPDCLAFDVLEDSDQFICSLANSSFVIEDNFGDFTIMHFEIEKMPCEFCCCCRFCFAQHKG